MTSVPRATLTPAIPAGHLPRPRRPSLRSYAARRTMRVLVPARRLVADVLTVLGVLAILGAIAITVARPAGAAVLWSWPVEPAEVVHGFAPPDVPWGSGHRGVDLSASIGQSVAAPAVGVVTFAGVIAGRGVVVVSHGAVRTTYEPVQAVVSVGAQVAAGDALGTLQAFAHHCTTPCLHWGAIQGDVYLDPTSFVTPKPSRLLPLWTDGSRIPTFAVGPGFGAVDTTVPARATLRPPALSSALPGSESGGGPSAPASAGSASVPAARPPSAASGSRASPEWFEESAAPGIGR